MTVDFTGINLERKFPPVTLNHNEGEQNQESLYQGQSVKQKFPNDAEKAKYYLWHISPDCSYDEWFRCASAFKFEGGSYADFEEWSAQSDKFDEATCKRIWNSVGSEDKLPVTLGTLIQYARQ